MSGKTKISLQKLFKLSYEKVYVISFEKNYSIPMIEPVVLNSLGKWYISTGKIWICHSDLNLNDFKTSFLELFDSDWKEKIEFEVDYLPFQQILQKNGVMK